MLRAWHKLTPSGIKRYVVGGQAFVILRHESTLVWGNSRATLQPRAYALHYVYAPGKRALPPPQI